MAEKKYIDPSLKKRNENGTNLDSRAMSKRRGRKKKTEGGTTAKPVKSVDKHVRFSKEEFEAARECMKKNRETNFAEYIRRAALQQRPIIIETDDFILLRQARRDFVNYINASGIKQLSEEDRKKVLTEPSTLMEWAAQLQPVVRQIDRLMDRIHNKVILPSPEDENK